MTRILYSSRFKKDLKRYQNKPNHIKALGTILKHLKDTGHVPQEYYPHKLHGIYEGCLECHIESNFLLIWVDESSGDVKLLRLGTHQEPFGM